MGQREYLLSKGRYSILLYWESFFPKGARSTLKELQAFDPCPSIFSRKPEGDSLEARTVIPASL
jgi:hypothetical protein